MGHFSELLVLISNVPCQSPPAVSASPHHTGHTASLSVCFRLYVSRARQKHIWLPGGPWSRGSDSEVLRCLFIARSLGAWLYSLWHFPPLICSRIVMECRSPAALCLCCTIFYMAKMSCHPLIGKPWCNLALIPSAACDCSHVMAFFPPLCYCFCSK